MMILERMAGIKNHMAELNVFSFTMDVDWASDTVIRYAVQYFAQRNLPFTLFFTHKSPYIDTLVKTNAVPYGIHPNFIQPSSQGKNKTEVIDYCMNQFPQAKVFRSHRWYADNDIYTELFKRGIRYESNLCTMMDVVQPFLHRSGMVSFPVFLEDGAYLFHHLDLHFSSSQKYFEQPGIKVINIHPMHLAINTPFFQYMRDIKDTLSREAWNEFSEENIEKYQNKKQRGIADFISECVEFIERRKEKVYTLEEMYHLLKGDETL